MLAGLKVVEVADELGEYCGLMLAGLGAEVIKIEPPEGSPTRHIGPYAGDVEDLENSLFFWAYNRGKQSITLDLAQRDDRQTARALIARADILLDSSVGNWPRNSSKTATWATPA